MFKSNLTQDSEVQVRVSYAENIALLAETALRFLEIVQLSTTTEASTTGEDQIEAQYKVSVCVMRTGPICGIVDLVLDGTVWCILMYVYSCHPPLLSPVVTLAQYQSQMSLT